MLELRSKDGQWYSSTFSTDCTAADAKAARGYPERRLEMVLYFPDSKEEVVLPIERELNFYAPDSALLGSRAQEKNPKVDGFGVSLAIW